MEKALRGQAARRRAKTPSWTLSGAARERLHAEVGRVHRRRPKRVWLPLWLKLAGAAAALGLAVFWLAPPSVGPVQTAQAPQPPPASASTTPAEKAKDSVLAFQPAPAAAQPPRAELQPSAAAVPAPAAGEAKAQPREIRFTQGDRRAAGLEAEALAEPPVQLQMEDPLPTAIAGKAEAAVSRLAAADDALHPVPAQIAAAAEPPPAPGRPVALRLETLAAAPKPALRVLAEQLAEPPAEADTREQAALLNVANLPATAANATESRNPPGSRFGFAAATPAPALLPQERELGRQALVGQAYSFRQAALPIPGPEVLRRFQLTRSESQVWVVDEDGSVYEPAPGGQAQAAGRANYFELVGTNKGLNQAVRFNGWILTNESSTAIMRRLAVPAGPPPGPVLQIQGSVKLGEGPELPIMANGSEISTNAPPP